MRQSTSTHKLATSARAMEFGITVILSSSPTTNFTEHPQPWSSRRASQCCREPRRYVVRLQAQLVEENLAIAELVQRRIWNRSTHRRDLAPCPDLCDASARASIRTGGEAARSTDRISGTVSGASFWHDTPDISKVVRSAFPFFLTRVLPPSRVH